MKLLYLQAYSRHIQDQVKLLINQKKTAHYLLSKYPERHDIDSDKQLYQYVMALKKNYLKQSKPLSKAVYSDKIHIIHHALGLHTTASRVQGNRLKAKHEIRVSGLFKQTPEAFLRMICVHELAHIKETEHNKAFYKLCQHMEPDYHQYELDLRIYLTHKDIEKETLWDDK